MKKDLFALTYPVVSPSLLAADRNKLPKMCQLAEQAGAKLIHFDVMDGKFVPNLALSSEELNKISKTHDLFNDVHLMVEDPQAVIKEFYEAGADIITFHYEAYDSISKIKETIDLIHSYGLYAGLSVKPGTDVNVLSSFLDSLDLVLLMSVEPGKGGQKFMMDSLERLRKIKNLRQEKGTGRRPVIEIDGGINELTGPMAIRYGADILVAGSYLFGHEDFKERLTNLLCG